MKGCCEVAAMFGVTCLDCNPKPRTKRTANPFAKTVSREKAYEVWQAGDWTWFVRKKWQTNDDAPAARWFCDVVTPMVPEGESGDVYVAEIKGHARRTR